MEESTIKEKVLKRIRNALISKMPNPYPNVDMGGAVFEAVSDGLDVSFAEELTKVGGHFIFCENREEMVANLGLLIQAHHFQPVFCHHKQLFNQLVEAGIPVENDPRHFAEVKAAVTYCEFLIARSGSVMVSSLSGPGRKINVFPEVHIVLAHSKQLVPDLKNAFSLLRQKYPERLPSMVSVITGPSRTADIEKTLIMGAHGPKELYVFLTDEMDS